VVSAVGHEVDFSIADLVADHRAPTPSAAAELLSPDQREWQQRLQAVDTQLQRFIRRRLADAATQLGHLRKRLKHPGAQLREQAQRLDDLEQRLVLAQKNQLQRRRAELDLLQTRLQSHSPLPVLHQLRRDTTQWTERLEAAMQHRLQQAADRLAHLAQMLDTLSPLATLKRGYAIVTDDQGKVVRDAGEVAVGDTVAARLARGRLRLSVREVVSDSEQE